MKGLIKMTDKIKIETLFNVFGISFGKHKPNTLSVGDTWVSFDFIFNDDGSLDRIDMSNEVLC